MSSYEEMKRRVALSDAPAFERRRTAKSDDRTESTTIFAPPAPTTKKAEEPEPKRFAVVPEGAMREPEKPDGTSVFLEIESELQKWSERLEARTIIVQGFLLGERVYFDAIVWSETIQAVTQAMGKEPEYPKNEMFFEIRLPATIEMPDATTIQTLEYLKSLEKGKDGIEVVRRVHPDEYRQFVAALRFARLFA